MKLTKRAIDAFEYAGGWDVRWDDEVPGLGVRVYPSGKRAFVLSYRSGGRKRLIVLGRYGADLTLDQARDKARKERVRVREGEDPLVERHRARLGQTFGELADHFVAYISNEENPQRPPRKKTWRDDRRRLSVLVPAAWRSRRADTITRADVRSLHAKHSERAPYEANRLLALLHRLFAYAVEIGLLPEGAANPAAGVAKNPEAERDRWLKPAELPQLAAVLDAEPNVYLRAFIWCLLLTGCRRGELLKAKWQDVDWDRAVLRLPETKSGRPQDVALSKQALAVLRAVPRVEGNDFVFVGDVEGKPMVEVGKPWRRIRKAAGLQDLRMHDLRRSTGSWMAQGGVDLNRIKDVLRHSNISTSLRYARLGADPARAAMEAHGEQVMAAAQGPAKSDRSGEH